jgi:Fuc2NAc and GlcNAc transferase
LPLLQVLCCLFFDYRKRGASLVMSVLSSGLSIGTVVLISALATRAVHGYALQRLLDVPNARSSHRIPTPRGGGLAIVAAFALAVVALYGQERLSLASLMALAGALPVAAIGFWDDHGHIPARWRLLVQFAAAGWSLYWIGGCETIRFGGDTYELGKFGTVLGAFFIVWMLNLFNFMDGIDGIAGVEVITAALSAALLLELDPSHATPESGAPIMLAAATAGFLFWNWSPAKIFMGDVGSGFVGFLLGIFTVWTATAGSLSLAVWLILVGVFFVDATVTLLRRMASGQRWYEAHRSHAYQQAAQRWNSHERVTLAVMIINLGWLLPLALGAVLWPRWEAALLVLAYAPLVSLAIRLNAGKS